MGISPLAQVSSTARIASDVSIGPYTVVHGNVEIGRGTTIESHCVVGQPTARSRGRALVIEGHALVRSFSVLYEGSTFGAGLVTGTHAILREGIEAGPGFQVGARAEFQGASRVGRFVRSQSGVFVPQDTTIGDFVWLLPNCVLTNDPHPPSDTCTRGPTIEDFAVICAMACVLPGLRVGRGSVVAAMCLVTRDVPPGVLVAGVPGRIRGPVGDVEMRDGSGRSAYPWPTHFERGYPDDVVRDWRRGEAHREGGGS